MKLVINKDVEDDSVTYLVFAEDSSGELLFDSEDIWEAIDWAKNVVESDENGFTTVELDIQTF